MKYRDFVVQISSRGDAGFVAEVLASPAGEDADAFEPPFDGRELPGLLRRLDAGIRGEAPAVRHAMPVTAPEPIPDPRQVGEALYKALFTGRILGLYQRSLGEVGHDGLRIKLKLSPRAAVMGRIQNLPWELLARPDGGDYLSLRIASPIVRYLDAPVAARPRRVPFRLHVLLAISQPTDLPALDLEQERRRLEAIGSVRLKIVILERADLASLRRALEAEPFHVLHFMGHGSTDPASGEGSLALMGEDDRADPVRAEVLGALLGEFTSLRLVVLNACLTGRATEPRTSASGRTAEDARVEYQPFAGVAQSLVRAGIPAVVAMQREISDPAANAFSEAFYRRIVAGVPVDAAVTGGRQAILDADSDSLEWSTPALFMRAPDGVLFRRWPRLRAVAIWLAAAAFVVMAIGDYRKLQAERESIEHNNRGITLIEDGRFADARQAFLTALDHHPDFAGAHSNLAELDIMAGLYEQAADRYLRATELEPDVALFRYNLGSTLLKLNRHTEAIDNLERAIELDPGQVPAYNELAKAYRELGRLADASRALEQGLAQDPDELPQGWEAPLYKNLGQVAMADGDAANAIRHFGAARSHYQPSDVSDLAEISLLLAAANHQVDDSAEVCRWLDELQRHAPDLVGPWNPDRPAELAASHGCTLRPTDPRAPNAANN